ncbi:UDP-N-acetylenolpyruvoylglucosamine reductase [Empedobacter stercoris]|uniref:UDP-N-acetylenolpyruvoylglucosamine reductase n=1 Tax=Empedobacter stercoris TaxID=1628248 RepID=UPI0039ED7D69
MVKASFFKEVVGRGKVFEDLVSSKIKTLNPPFADLIRDGYQIHLLRTGSSNKIIADDLFVKKVFDEIEEVDYYRAVISDSKLNAGSPWTANQKSELIDIFKNDKTKEFIEFQVRTNPRILIEKGAPSGMNTIRIYREDVYKIISEGDNIKVPPIKLNSNNFN